MQSSRSAGACIRKAIVGPVIHSLSQKKLEILPRAAIVVNGTTGRIENIIKEYNSNLQIACDEVIELRGNQLLIPGLVDTHTHAPQYLNSGIGYDEQLLEWLKKYTFPAEAKFKDVNFARAVYERAVRRLLINGTTTAVYFATIHGEASVELANICKQLGQRALIGKVNMDQEAPEFYVEKTNESLLVTEQAIRQMIALNHAEQHQDSAASQDDEKQEIQSNPGDLIIPIITPRFAPTCSAELMQGLGELAKRYALPIQSHVSENLGEVRWIRDLFPDEKSYVAVYDKFGLLTDRTVLAHGVLLTDEEVQLLRERGSSISHCALSNFSINSGVANVRRLLDNGVKVGLGTDVSGGYSPSMFNAIRTSLIASVSNSSQYRVDNKNIDGSVKGYLEKSSEEFSQKMSQVPKPLGIEELFYMATLGGADTVGLANEIGNFTEGKQFDALVIDIDAKDSPIDSFMKEEDDLAQYKPHELLASSPEQQALLKFKLLFDRFLYLGDDRNIVKVFVAGHQVHSRQ